MVRAEYSLDIIVSKLQEILDYGIGYSDAVGQNRISITYSSFRFCFSFFVFCNKSYQLKV